MGAPLTNHYVMSMAELRIVFQEANLAGLLKQFKRTDNVAYRIVHDMQKAILSEVAASGSEPRQAAASEEREYWTVPQLHRASRRGETTIRKDIRENRLPATQVNGTWLIANGDARTYIASRRKN